MSDFDSCQFMLIRMVFYNWQAGVNICARSNVTLDTSYMWWVYGQSAFVRYVITKFSRMDSLPNFLTYGAPLINIWISYIATAEGRNKFRDSAVPIYEIHLLYQLQWDTSRWASRRHCIFTCKDNKLFLRVKRSALLWLHNKSRLSQRRLFQSSFDSSS